MYLYFLLEIQCLGLSLIGCLMTKKNVCTGAGHQLAKILVSSLQRFKDVPEVQVKVSAVPLLGLRALGFGYRSLLNFWFAFMGIAVNQKPSVLHSIFIIHWMCNLKDSQLIS